MTEPKVHAPDYSRKVIIDIYVPLILEVTMSRRYQDTPKRNTYLNRTQVACLLSAGMTRAQNDHGFWGLCSGFWLGGFTPDQWLDKVRTIPRSVEHTLTTTRPANETAHLSLQPTLRGDGAESVSETSL